MEIGSVIMNKRKALGYTQQTLADKLHVSFQAVSKWENGDACPEIELLPAIATILGTSVDTLLGYRSAIVADYEERVAARKRISMGKTLYVTDLDGTLMRDDKSISEKTVTILNRLIDRGLPVTYATARSLGSASAITKAIHFSLPVILRNGTNIADPQTGEEIKRASFKAEKIQEIRQCIGGAKIPGYVTAYIRGEEKTLYLVNLLNEGFQAYLEDHMNDKRLQAVQTEKELYEGEVCYFTFIAKREELDPLYERVKDGREWNCVYQKDTYRSEFWLEICPKDATKAKAVQKVQKMCDCERVVVFGDSLNDISMFQIADEAYAVANAAESLKAAATGVIGDNNSDGVAEWLWQNVSCKK